jgi:peroxiredoxin (alkyl hydroperoxide reductase subunit C)
MIFQLVDQRMKHFDFFKLFNILTNMAKVSWRPGADTIIPNPEEKLKYFSKNYETKKN